VVDSIFNHPKPITWSLLLTFTKQTRTDTTFLATTISKALWEFIVQTTDYGCMIRFLFKITHFFLIEQMGRTPKFCGPWGAFAFALSKRVLWFWVPSPWFLYQSTFFSTKTNSLGYFNILSLECDFRLLITMD
jgi:hypothetical protein